METQGKDKELSPPERRGAFPIPDRELKNRFSSSGTRSEATGPAIDFQTRIRRAGK